MIFGNWRGMPLALALATTLGLSMVLARSARADGLLFQHTIPREVDAYNFTTGGPFMAPPVPYGHYAKDSPLYAAHKHMGCVTCKLHALMGGGGSGHSFFHKGHGDDDGYGHGHHDGGWESSGYGAGPGLFGDPVDSSSGVYAGGEGLGAGSAGFATTWGGPSGQTGVSSSGQAICGQPGCNVACKHSHLGHMFGSHGGGYSADPCGDPGCGVGGKHGHGTGCGLCGGKGCLNCLAGLKSGLHSKLASLGAGFHKPRMSWFLGAGGPVPLTPGYVPYIVATRSPRDFFAFPPMNPNDP